MAQPEGRGRPAPPAPDPLDRLDDPDRPTYTIGQAAELLGVQVAFLRSLDSSGVVEPARSAGGHRRWSRAQLRVAARVRVLLDDGHPLGSAEVIIGLQDDVAALQDRLDRS
ncbi:helix-turn-helix domain-containing protein [Klenkia taihuensis]|uniref:MerR HTH family regulatory protein n=1 Tax=Klenkia taihuensis TaxID=1225127 RepID=A0A1I1Q5I2_9ACTN|nr:helix-turn-helix domain-containing protein [Klenkia taihuensis]GHE08134.1 MerR family transcriptional regulator [Klenkia taihuensis]SFD17309.1 MerR HTH family regulatory protein [Klenkia taihuensis]